MTVSTVLNKKTHTGNGVATAFPYDFFIPDAASLRVYLLNTTTGENTLLSSGSYSVTGLDSPSFGEVTYPLSGSPITSAEKLTIMRVVAYDQEADIRNQSGFFPEVIEDALDHIVYQVQQVAEEVARSLKFPSGEVNTAELPTTALRAGKVQGYDGDGNLTLYTPTSSSSIAVGGNAIRVLDYMDGVPDGTTYNNSAILAALAACSSGDTLLFENTTNPYVYAIEDASDTIELTLARLIVRAEGARIKIVSINPSTRGVWPMFRALADQIAFVDLHFISDEEPLLWNINLQYTAAQYHVRGVIEIGTDQTNTVVTGCKVRDCRFDNVVQCAISARQAYGLEIVRPTINGQQPIVTVGTTAITTGLNYMGIMLAGCENTLIDSPTIDGMVEGITTGRTDVSLPAPEIDFGYGFGIPEDSRACRITTIVNARITRWWDHAIYASVGSHLTIIGGKYQGSPQYRQGGSQALKATGEHLLIVAPEIIATSGISVQKIGSTIRTADVSIVAPVIRLMSPWRIKWVAGAEFAVDDVALDHLTLEVYRCAVPHTAGSGTFAADRAAHPTYWTLELSGNQVLLGPNRMGIFLQSVEDAEVVGAIINYEEDDYHNTVHGIRLGNQTLSSIAYPCKNITVRGGIIRGRFSTGVGVTESSPTNAAEDIRVESTVIDLIPDEVGLWTNEQRYVADEIVRDPATGDFWKSNETHTSPTWGTSFSADRTANPDRWTLWAKQFSGAAYTAWANGASISIGDKRRDTHTGKVFNALTAHTTPATGTFAADRSANPSRWEFYSEDIENSYGVYFGYARDCKATKNEIRNAGAAIGAADWTGCVLQDNDLRGAKYQFIRTAISGSANRSIRNRMSDWQGPVPSAEVMTEFGSAAYNSTQSFVEILPAAQHHGLVDRGNWATSVSYVAGDLVVDPDDSITYHCRRMHALPAAWANGTAYVEGDQRTDTVDGSVWQCAVDHTSIAGPSTFADDRTANPTYWVAMYETMAEFRAAFPYHWADLSTLNYVVPYPGDPLDIYVSFTPATAFNVRFINSLSLPWPPGTYGEVNNGNTGATPNMIVMQSGAGSFSETLPADKSLSARSTGGNDAWILVYAEQDYRTQGRETEWIPASAMIARTTGGATAGTVETTTNLVMVSTLNFPDGASKTYAQFNWVPPKRWNRGQVWARFFWTTTAASGTTSWQIQAMALTDTEALDTSFGLVGTLVTVYDAATAADRMQRTAETDAITVNSAPTAGDLVTFQISRDPTLASDTLAADAKLIGVSLIWFSNAANDA